LIAGTLRLGELSGLTLWERGATSSCGRHENLAKTRDIGVCSRCAGQTPSGMDLLCRSCADVQTRCELCGQKLRTRVRLLFSKRRP
jgi:hypothetical protein